MEDEVKTIRDELKKLRNQVARLTDQVTDQIEINQFLRKVNLELDEEKNVCAVMEKKSQKDNINPTYYVGSKIQVSDFIAEFKLDYFSGNVIKYVVRQKFKNGLEDLKKARWYLDKLIQKHPDSEE